MQALGKIACERGIPASGTSGEVSRLQRAGVNLLSVVNDCLGVVGDHDLLCAPIIEHLRRFAPIGAAGKNFRLRRIGLQEANHRQILLLQFPIAEQHRAAFVAPQQALDVHRAHSALCRRFDHVLADIADHQSREVIDRRARVR